MNNHYRNIHIQPNSPDQNATQLPQLPRLRSLKNDPAREYAQRPGEVETLPDSVAALILCKSGFTKVERHQLKVTLDGKEYFFASSNSITIATKNGTDEKVLWVINRHAPDVLHILGRDGEYIESIPRKGRADWFSADEASREALAETKRMRGRDMARLNEIHAPDIEAALEREQHNAGEIKRLVNIFPAPVATAATAHGSRIPKPATTRADVVTAAIASVDQQRSRHRATVVRDTDLANEADEALDALHEESQLQPTLETQETYEID